jgi:tetratricopeptide (TPR) repeat protein
MGPFKPTDRLDSWKAIATHLNRTVRTVQRWQREGLPVHRHQHRKLGSVFALPEELDEWCRQRLAAGAVLNQRDHYYLLSRHHLAARTNDSLQKSAKYAQLSIERDQQFAPGHAALALAYAVLASYGACKPHTLMPQARTAAIRALQLDPNLAEAYCALGLVALLYDREWDMAERSFCRAMRVRPGYASIYQWLAIQRFVTMRYEDALRLLDEARARDPLSPMMGAQHGWFLTLLRRYEDALAVVETAIELDPLFFRAYANLAWVYLELGRPQEALDAVRRASTLNGLPLFEPTVAECEASIGDRAAAISRMRELEARGEYVSPYWRARAWTRSGDADRALTLLEESVEAREWFVILLGHEPAFDPLRDDIRFTKLLTRVGLPS